MSCSNSILLIAAFLFGVLLTGIIGIVLALQGSYKVAEGDRAFGKGNISTALQKYSQAQMIWPLYRFDTRFNQKVAMTKEYLEAFKKRPAVSIFITSSASNSDIHFLVNEIKSKDGIKEVRYLSKDQALSLYREQNKNDPALLDLVTADILPPSIEVYFIRWDDLLLKDNISRLAKNKSFVSDVVTSPGAK